MAERSRFGLEGETASGPDPRFDPDPMGRLFLIALFALWLIFAGLVWHAESAEKDTRPALWIYTAPGCPPCAALKSDIKAGHLAEFRIVHLRAPEEFERPAIYFRNSKGKWAEPFVGWGPGSLKTFKAYWKREQKR